MKFKSTYTNKQIAEEMFGEDITKTDLQIVSFLRSSKERIIKQTTHGIICDISDFDGISKVMVPLKCVRIGVD